MSIEKWWKPGQYREEVESMPLLKNCPDEFRKRVESVRVPENGTIQASTGKGRIRATIEKLSGRVSEKGRISVNTEKWYESGRFLGKGRIRATIENLSGRVSEKGRISVSIGK